MTFDEKYYNIGFLDQLSYKNTIVHRLDPRAKVIITLLFLFTVISFPKYEIVALLPFFLYPVLLMTLGEIPFMFIFKKVVFVSPFAVFIGIFNPLLDSGQVSIFHGFMISAGWFSFFSILIKFTLTVSTALLLIATTSFPNVCHALRQLGLPSLFVSQLLFLYRYIFVLMEETMRIVRARNMRSYEKRGHGIRVFVRIIGILFLRTVERAERIYFAMLSRGFQGDMPTLKRFHFSRGDLGFAVFFIVFLFIFRFYPATEILGRFVQGVFS
ncbi:MAG: cobalt ECF transporter T component CbiQ [Deltaproteobacteria bacterium HGW-Deltaproteobacteria-7]|jgi:cobalt/nickel transport system permease protein|nr:MAG: cobalt ECF transporter T component CbiQ [Deltaproteobacteria bacterium HGW-Deltaproteobacteria-7]PKN53157.1 MAG: cobalt ECF transporter T component CbiQ [Deltaproteobacteria bacterium HGW-Deltaproteobacteria-13]